MEEDCFEDFSKRALKAASQEAPHREAALLPHDFSPRLSELCENNGQATRACVAFGLASVIELANGWDSQREAVDALESKGLPKEMAVALLVQAEAHCMVRVRKAARFGLLKSEGPPSRPQTCGIPASSEDAWPLPPLTVPYESSDPERVKVKKAALTLWDMLLTAGPRSKLVSEMDLLPMDLVNCLRGHVLSKWTDLPSGSLGHYIRAWKEWRVWAESNNIPPWEPRTVH